VGEGATVSVDIRTGHVLEVLASFGDGTAQTCVTSPPYWGLRDYGTEPVLWPRIDFAPAPGLPELTIPAETASLGLERDPWAFVGHMVLVFREVRRVLADDGTLWLNMGDSYANRPHGAPDATSVCPKGGPGRTRRSRPNRRRDLGHLKHKDMVGMPWRLALALQADGWTLRSEIIWHKPNGLPENVRDRPTKVHEQIFLLTNGPRYYFDQDAVRERSSGTAHARGSGVHPKAASEGSGVRANESFCSAVRGLVDTRNVRTVWKMQPGKVPEAHFATFPPELPERCIRAGSAADDVVLDPFTGSGTTGIVARRLGRRFLGVELNEDYAQMARERIARDTPPSAADLEAAGIAGQVGLFGSAP